MSPIVITPRIGVWHAKLLASYMASLTVTIEEYIAQKVKPLS